MSNLTLFANGNNLPVHLQRRELSETTKALMGGGFTKRISIEGGAFRLIAGGQEVATKEERHMNVVIVRAADSNSRTYYQGTYVKGAKVKPTCWSDNGATPHEDVKNPQSSNCATCPQNVKGSGQNDSRACRYQRRLAVVLENDMEGDIYAMSIPAASLFDQGEGRKMGLQQYARFLGSHGVDVNAVVTEMRFDMNATAPKLNFSAVRPLEANEYEAAIRRRDEPAAIDAVTMTVGALDGAEETSTAAPADASFAAQAPTPVPVQQPATPAPAVRPAPAKAAAPAKPAAPAAPAGFTLSKDVPVSKAAEPVAEPVVRTATAPVPNVPNVASILDQWGDDTDD